MGRHPHPGHTAEEVEAEEDYDFICDQIAQAIAAGYALETSMDDQG